MKRIALVAVGAAVVGLAACTHAAAPAAHDSARAPVSCAHRYQTWEAGPGKGVIPTISAVAGVSTAGDPQRLTAELKAARATTARGARYPVPACADPRGYWDVLMMHVNAAVTGKSSASAARAALQGVPGIENQLIAEIKSAVSRLPVLRSY